MEDKSNELTVTEASELSGYSGRHIRRLVKQGRVEGRRAGDWLYLIDRESLMAYVAQMESLGGAKHDPNV